MQVTTFPTEAPRHDSEDATEPPRQPGLADARHALCVTTVAEGRFCGPDGRPVLTWLHRPESGRGLTGVVILPGIGYEYWSSYRALRTLAEACAGRGCTVIRLDYDGTGNAAGSAWDDGRLEAWRASVRYGVEEIRALGARRVVLVGLRLGACLALSEGARCGADDVVAWAPVVQGRRYRRELEMLAEEAPKQDGDREPRGGRVVAGVYFSEETLSDLAGIDLGDLEAIPSPRVLVVDRPDGPASVALLERLGVLGGEVDHLKIPGSELILDVPSEKALVPTGIVEAVADWIAAGGPIEDGDPCDEVMAPVGRAAATLSWAGRQLREEVVSLTDAGLVAVLTGPVEGGEGPTVVFVSAGSEPHVGPGRAWVEYARDLSASCGWRAVRVDFSEWGESPSGSGVPGRPFDPHTPGEVAAIVRALRASGHDQVVVVGLCAGAWSALEALETTEIDGVVAINPQLYYRPGEEVFPVLGEWHLARAGARRRERIGSRLGLWSLLDVVGLRGEPGRRLDKLGRSGTPVLMVFSEGDDGIAYLRSRLKRRLCKAVRRGSLKVVEIQGIDHAMHRSWRRPAVVEAITTFVEEIDRARSPATGRGPSPVRVRSSR